MTQSAAGNVLHDIYVTWWSLCLPASNPRLLGPDWSIQTKVWVSGRVTGLPDEPHDHTAKNKLRFFKNTKLFPWLFFKSPKRPFSTVIEFTVTTCRRLRRSTLTKKRTNHTTSWRRSRATNLSVLVIYKEAKKEASWWTMSSHSRACAEEKLGVRWKETPSRLRSKVFTQNSSAGQTNQQQRSGHVTEVRQSCTRVVVVVVV